MIEILIRNLNCEDCNKFIKQFKDIIAESNVESLFVDALRNYKIWKNEWGKSFE